MNIRKISFLLFIVLVSISLTSAQTTNNSEKVDEKTADVAITANVTAKELKFETVPNPKVDFPRTPERKTEWSSERKNLPDSVQPNVIYRDIGIKLKIVSVFADIDKIVDDALNGQKPTETAQKSAAPVISKPKENVSTAKLRKTKSVRKARN